MEVISRHDWIGKAQKLFGGNPTNWKFKCVSCGEEQTAMDFIDAGIEQEKAIQLVYQECIGRHVKDKGCDWALYGLLTIHELEVEYEGTKIAVFKFAETQDQDR